MEWYYAESNQQKGPVNEAEFDALVKAGTVRPDTLVWREGMSDWRAYSTVAGEGTTAPPAAPVVAAVASEAAVGAGGILCSQCGRGFQPDQVIRYGDAWVCAGCKPAFLQRLKEGVTPAGVLEYATFWTRFAAKFVDRLILSLVGMVLGLVFGVGIGAGMASGTVTQELAFVYQMLLWLVSFGVELAYGVFFLGRFGATPGKMACKIKVVNADGTPIGYGKAAGRCVAEWLSSLTCLIGYIIAAFDDERRTLHDRLCGTRVIRS